MRCPRMDELPVVTEWQNRILCPDCKFYHKGTCQNPIREKETDRCPFENMETVEIKRENNMDVYYVKPKGLASCSFDDLNDAIEELRIHLQEGVEEVNILRKEMTQEEYDNLPELEGY